MPVPLAVVTGGWKDIPKIKRNKHESTNEHIGISGQIEEAFFS